MEFEDLLEKVGGFGKFQKKLTILFIIPVYCVIPWFWLNRIFILSVPQHWCNVPELANLSIEEQRTLISPPSDPSCSMYNINYTDMLMRGIFKAPNDTDIIPCMDGWRYDTKDYEHTAATKWDMVCEYDYLSSLIFTLANVGTLIGTPIYGFLSDKFGRKIAFLFLAVLVVVTELASAIVNSFAVFVTLRILNGSCMPSMYTLPYILTLELVSPNMRGHINGIINTCWTLGLCLLPLTAYLSRSWTILCYVTTVAGLFILSYCRFMPESPSWLLSQGKFDDAMKVMIRIGKDNGQDQNQAEMLLQLKLLKETTKMQKENENSSPQPFFILKCTRLRRHFLILSICWMTFNVTLGSLTYNLVNLHGNEFMNFFMVSAVEFPGNFAFWFAMDYFGRRWVSTFGFGLTGIICLLPLIGFTNSGIISSMMGKFLITGIYMVIDQQGLELFPTVARSFCMGAGKTISNAVGMFSPLIAYLSMYGKWIPFIVMSSACFLACMLSSFLPESLDENLPHTIADAEKFGEDQTYFSWKKSQVCETRHRTEIEEVLKEQS